MQEYWEIYMKNLEGHPASIQFNAGISMDLEQNKYIYPTVAFVKVMLKEPSEKGLLSESEEPEILYIEDKLEAAMLKFRIGKYVGRVITQGSVTFIFYLQFTYNWQDFLEYALDEFEGYEIENGFSEDSEWNYYQNLLFPTATEWQIIQNHKVCDSLKANGDALHQKRAIEHRIFFTDIDLKDTFLEEVSKEGFKYMEDVQHEEGFDGVKIYRQDKPFYYDIDEVTLYLINTAGKYGAQYDGWETSLVKL
jgi:regulator of RNase E activity RraB